MLPARRVAALMEAFAAIAHVRIVRWHTRVPVVDPARVTPAFTRALMIGDKAVYVGVHANHPREFTPEARAALKRLNTAGAVLLSQSVLLKGVNADPETLAALMRAFVENSVTPYYLHHPDLAPGTAHFRLPIAEGQALVASLRGHLSGLAQPTYVLDIPGGFGKIPIGPAFLEALPDGSHLATDRAGRRHRYPPEPSA
jgi:lysine 2,3-aminomutase